MSNSSITTEAGLTEPIHPGEILMEVFIEGFGIIQNKPGSMDVIAPLVTA